MRFHFVEIGTCDYDTLLESCRDDQLGISVEPIKAYLDRLPSRPNVTKIHAAISSADGLVDLYWVRPEHHDGAAAILHPRSAGSRNLSAVLARIGALMESMR